jgi:hypothetical protein
VALSLFAFALGMFLLCLWQALLILFQISAEAGAL